MAQPYEIGVYYFPNYHVDPRNETVHGAGWTEWELMKQAQPRFPNHSQPRVPLWGYEDEAAPFVMAKKIDAAADHGINHFLFDWYWYNDGPFLGRALDEGFLRAPNCNRLKFALMWANHDWFDIHPAKRGGTHPLLYPGSVTLPTFNTIVEHVIEHYFLHPSYWLLKGCPYFSIYELMTFVQGMGGLEAARAALAEFRARTRAAGFPDLHLNAVVWGVQILPNEQKIEEPNELLRYLGFDSITSYVWIHHVPLAHFPETDYSDVAGAAQAHWHTARREYSLPYHPNVTMGWDSSPRTVQSDVFSNVGYPFMPTLSYNTPQHFRQALEQARQFLDENDEDSRILTINAWNEWSEGSYLEPDTEHGFAYLEAIRDVFRPS